MIHHVAATLPEQRQTPAGAVPEDLSTIRVHIDDQAVDNLIGRQRVGVVVPKRHARRAVTRSMLKRLLRASFARQQSALAPGDWLLRLRSPFAPPAFISADSGLLRQVARDEIDALLHRASADPARRAATTTGSR